MGYNIYNYILFSVPEQMLMMAIFWTLINRHKNVLNGDLKLYLVSTFGFCLIYFITANLNEIHFIATMFLPMVMNVLMMAVIGFYYEDNHIENEDYSNLRNMYEIIKLKVGSFRKFLYYSTFVYFSTVSAQYPISLFVDRFNWGSIDTWSKWQQVQYHFTIHYGILALVLFLVIKFKEYKLRKL